MPRIMAPPPSGEFAVRLAKPFSGTATHSIEIIGEPNRSATVKVSHNTGGANSTEKSGDVPKEDVNELLELISALRGYPSDPTSDIFGADTKLEFNTFEINWANDDEPTNNDVKEIAAESKDEFKRVADSIEALARTFAKKDTPL